jgi:glutathione S-transferase
MSGSSSYDQTVPGSSTSTDVTLELGKRLASSLEEWDVLGRWMAHYVAELIAAVEAADGDAEVAAAKARAAEEILILWSHRSTMPRPYPLESFDRVFAALDRLELRSPASRLSRYFGDDAPTAADLAVVPFLEIAARVDDELSDVVAWLISEAAAAAADAEAPWVPIAVGIGEDESARALRRLMSLTRRRRLAARMRQSAPEDEAATIPAPDADAADDEMLDDEITVDEALTVDDFIGGVADPAHLDPWESETAESADEEGAIARKDALVEAIDRAAATLLRLRSAVTNSGVSAKS